MYRHHKEILCHILDECNYINALLINGLDRETFLRDETLKRAVVRSLEIIGEATKQIPADIKIKMSHIKWKEMAGMRDRLIHDYMGVNYNIVWDVASDKIPKLTPQIVEAISTM
ncbi:MAG: DUF86 domain-containing protein [Cytophagales bacterium]